MNIDVHSQNLDLSPELRHHAERSLTTALGRFESRIDRVRVGVTDVNGPKGGIDKVCRIQVKGDRGWEVIVTAEDADAFAVIDRAGARASQAVSRRIERDRA